MTKEKKLGLNLITTILGAFVLTSNVQANELFGEITETSGASVIGGPTIPDYALADKDKAAQRAKEAVYQNQSQYTGYEVNRPPVSTTNGLPAIPENVKDRARRAFEKAKTDSVGLTPEMIKAYKATMSEKQKALNAQVEDYPVAESRSIPISLGVSNQKEIIRVAAKMSTVISVVDSTGKPWSVINYGLGNKNNFDLIPLDGEGGNLFSLTTNSQVGRSNMMLLLKEGHTGVKVPVVLEVIAGQKAFDDKVVLRVQAVGPNGSVEQAKLSQGVDSKYNAWLDGIVPRNVREIKSNDPFTRAWKEADGSIVLISKHHIYSPDSSVLLSSADGEETLYKLRSKSSVVWARDNTQKEFKISLYGF